jgi:hypothetical protein
VLHVRRYCTLHLTLTFFNHAVSIWNFTQRRMKLQDARVWRANRDLERRVRVLFKILSLQSIGQNNKEILKLHRGKKTRPSSNQIRPEYKSQSQIPTAHCLSIITLHNIFSFPSITCRSTNYIFLPHRIGWSQNDTHKVAITVFSWLSSLLRTQHIWTYIPLTT